MKIIPFFLLAFCFSLITFWGCKSPKEPAVDPDLALVSADSSNYSTMMVSCKSSDGAATGIGVIDIQEFYLAGKSVSSTTKGKMFSVKTANLAPFKAAVDKVIVDLQTPESYFKNYDSFILLLEEQFKTKTGFQKSYDLTKIQIEQLFSSQEVPLTVQEVPNAGLRLSADKEIFTLNALFGAGQIRSKVIGTANICRKLKTAFVGESIRSTVATQNNQIVVSNFNTLGYQGGYSYNYPLPPSPAPIFDAPSWYWHKFTDAPSGTTFTVFPTTTSVSSFTITNFNNPPSSDVTLSNAKIVGSEIEFAYSGTGSQLGASYNVNRLVNIGNGLESTFEFSGTKGSGLILQLRQNGSFTYNSLGIYGIGSTGANVAYPAIASESKEIPHIFDGKTHKVKVSLMNRTPVGSTVQVFVDNMNQPIFLGINYTTDVNTYFTTIAKQPTAERFISLIAFHNPLGEGKMTIKSWSFKAF